MLNVKPWQPSRVTCRHQSISRTEAERTTQPTNTPRTTTKLTQTSTARLFFFKRPDLPSTPISTTSSIPPNHHTASHITTHHNVLQTRQPLPRMSLQPQGGHRREILLQRRRHRSLRQLGMAHHQRASYPWTLPLCRLSGLEAQAEYAERYRWLEIQ